MTDNNPLTDIDIQIQILLDQVAEIEAEMSSLSSVTAANGQEALRIGENLKEMNAQINDLKLQVAQLQGQKLNLAFAAQRAEDAVKDVAGGAKGRMKSEIKKQVVSAGVRYAAAGFFGPVGIAIIGVVVVILIIIAVVLVKAEEVRNDPRAVLEVVTQCGASDDSQKCLTDLVQKKVGESVRCRNVEEDNAECK